MLESITASSLKDFSICSTEIYYIDNWSVLVENRPLLKFIWNYIRDLGDVFSILSLVRMSMTLLFVITKRKLHGRLKI